MIARPSKIISGGQTGADRAALDAAIELGIAHGGWCPRGRRAEDGPIPARYSLEETDSPEYAVRTELNIRGSDATLIVGEPPLSGGTALTERLACRHGKPYLLISPSAADEQAVATVRQWLQAGKYTVLNVAGPRESQLPGIGRRTFELLLAIFSDD